VTSLELRAYAEGVFAGRPVLAFFSHYTDCDAARWNRHRLPVPAALTYRSGVSLLAPFLAALAFTGSTGAAPTDLRIVVWPNGPGDGGRRVFSLRCGPAGGTLPRTAAACQRLAALERPFAPVPKDTACTEIFGGPQVGRVTGTFQRRRVWATFRRTDGCEIARWNRVRFLFPISTGPR
jgi:hypothetical protein